MKKLLTLLLMMGALPAFAAEAERPSISVNGEAMAKLAPDQVTISAEAYAEDVDLAKAKQKANEKLKSILAVAKEYNVPAEKMQTNASNVQPLYDYVQNAKPKFRAYMVSTNVSLTLAEVAKAGEFMEALTKKGIDRINGVNFSLKDEKKARDDIMVKAIQDARAKADRIAGALGVKVGKPLSVTESGGGVQYPPRPYRAKMAMADAAAAPEAAPELPSGEIEIRQNVSVSFAIE